MMDQSQTGRRYLTAGQVEKLEEAFKMMAGKLPFKHANGAISFELELPPCSVAAITITFVADKK